MNSPHDDSRDYTEQQSTAKRQKPRRFGVGTGLLVAGAVGAMMVGGVALAVSPAAGTPTRTASNTSTTHPDRGPALTAEQQDCLSAQGITKPDGRPTDAQRTGFEAAAKACNITLPARGAGHGPALTATQQACLTAAGITKPTGDPAKVRPTKAQIKKLKAAAKKCGVTLPKGGPGDKAGGPGHGLALTAEQQSCLTAAGITKPEGRPTDAQRTAFEAAAKPCHITLPAHPAGGPR